MTTANKITIFRILLIPFFVVQVLQYIAGHGEWHRLLAVLTFAVASICDGVDGYVARRYHQRSELGAILDPLADKLLLVSAILLLSLHGEAYLPHLPLHLTFTVLTRDLLLVLGALLIRYIGVHLVVRPHWSGKVATVLQMVCVLWALCKLDEDWGLHWLPTLAWGATIFTAASGVIYGVVGIRELSSHPASLPSPPVDHSAGAGHSIRRDRDLGKPGDRPTTGRHRS